MVLTITSSFVSGLFATLGVLCATAIVAFAVYIIKMWAEARNGRKNLPQIMLEYRKTLLKNDMFEEYVFITKFVKQLKKNKVPKELSEKYILDVNCDLGWLPDGNGYEKLGLRYKYKLIPRVPFIKKKEENKNGSEEETKKQ
jgi:hypothetical protein